MKTTLLLMTAIFFNLSVYASFDAEILRAADSQIGWDNYSLDQVGSGSYFVFKNNFYIPANTSPVGLIDATDDDQSNCTLIINPSSKERYISDSRNLYVKSVNIYKDYPNEGLFYINLYINESNTELSLKCTLYDNDGKVIQKPIVKELNEFLGDVLKLHRGVPTRI